MSPRKLHLVFSVLLLAPLAWSPSPGVDPEVARIQRHILRAERLASRQDIAALTASQRVAREKNLARLEQYRRAGVFPHNHDFAGARVPYFQDRHGTPCAMAHLIRGAGRGDIVDAGAHRMNNASVMAIATDEVLGPVLAAWLRDQGLSLQEAQAIQPEYGDGGGGIVDSPNLIEPTNITPAYAISSMTLGGFRSEEHTSELQ